MKYAIYEDGSITNYGDEEELIEELIFMDCFLIQSILNDLYLEMDKETDTLEDLENSIIDEFYRRLSKNSNYFEQEVLDSLYGDILYIDGTFGDLNRVSMDHLKDIFENSDTVVDYITEELTRIINGE